MKTIILYCNRQTGIAALLYLKARGFDVMVITDGDLDVEWVARKMGVPILPSLDFLRNVQFDLFLCVHGRKIIPEEYLVMKKFVNIHPCLGIYNGHNPIKRYIKDEATSANVASHYMTEVVDEGDLICEVGFNTEVCKTYADFYNVAMKYYYLVLEETLKIVL